jgi:hypothetical protein
LWVIEEVDQFGYFEDVALPDVTHDYHLFRQDYDLFAF